MTRRPIRLAVDIGGTFVDAMELDTRTNRVRFRKAATTPARPADGVLNAITALGTDLSEVELFIHGTTLGLNAVLERRGGRTGIITNEGFRDIFLIGRGNVPSDHMYDFQYQRPESLVQRRFTAGVRGRLDYRGRVVEPLDPDSVREAARTLVVDQQVTSIAICFLHSFLDPSHEREAARLIHEEFPEVSLSLSTDIVREYREYERTSTTVLEAYIRPIFERYVDELESGLAERGFAGRFLIMRSGGGSMTSAVAKTAPTHTVLSGPAGGIVGAAYVASELGRDNVLTFDIGGTSLDACVIERGNPVAAYEAQLEHFPLLIPTYDIRTIGAGGGSIAWLDHGLLKVGPQSAGADPGPVCYGRGGARPTVTDAAVVLGYMDPDRFLAGTMGLRDAEARAAIQEQLADPLGLSVENAAAGVFDVLLARTVGAVRQITVERGHDPRQFALLAFGGAGPLLAPLLAREMGIGEVVVPFAPSGFSAWGMLSADIVNDFSRTVMATLDDADLSELEQLFKAVEAEAVASLVAQGVPAGEAVLERQFELRYLGQEHSLMVTVGRELDRDAVRAAFDETHRTRYGHTMGNPLQILNLRVRGIGRTDRPALETLPRGDGDPSQALLAHRDAYDFGQHAVVPFAVYDRARLEPGDTFDGPALVDEGTSTTVVPSGQRVTVDDHGYLLVTLEEAA
ncbi:MULTISPECIES: hydantoinase/oxoprolinase family protein [unclassified Micromonospora]|uniref:hydantoinase/oxoprolinase family protein n=1 Tax=unclassified Micromonospora TaxID=2617518 RepID=UPI00188E4009|nr:MULTISPECIES: hydantoinase/oxoprolinase family protein [unclassified Micromonospora]MBF5030810.1 hydantoinase/oxoprolinase family protein [Micromonospora sp. ANENR4]MCZ7474178.1 hydantoinase/oxoprolinase family protein [Micromonospora sp. WMMC273]WBC04832.1 hydantoinase/oxoprolinase family protein [Micromonospora sp. WMMA1976]